MKVGNTLRVAATSVKVTVMGTDADTPPLSVAKAHADSGLNHASTGVVAIASVNAMTPVAASTLKGSQGRADTLVCDAGDSHGPAITLYVKPDHAGTMLGLVT